MKITTDLISSFQSQTELDKRINSLLFGFNDFFRHACTDGRLFGVETACDTCTTTFNSCLRNHLLNKLLEVNQTVDQLIGYDLTPTYRTETKTWDGHSRIQTNRPGITKVGFKEEVASISGATYSVTPYILEDLETILQGSGDDKYCIVRLPTSVVKNPNNVILRDSNGVFLERSTRFGYPKRNGTNWEIALDENQAGEPCGQLVNVQDCQIIGITTSLHTVSSGYIAPVYVGTIQKIPQAKTRTVGTSTITWWFYVWDLMDESFFDEGLDFLSGDFYKLLGTIEIKHFYEVADTATVRYYDTCCGETRTATEEYVSYVVVDAEQGIFEVYKNATPCSECCYFSTDCDCKKIIDITYSYVTYPIHPEAEQQIHEAASYLIAAELPLNVCGCDVKSGFIYIAQQPYTKIINDPVTGVQTAYLKYGELFGQLTFAEKISKVPKYRKRLVI